MQSSEPFLFFLFLTYYYLDSRYSHSSKSIVLSVSKAMTVIQLVEKLHFKIKVIHPPCLVTVGGCVYVCVVN